ncbi:MAG TPA: tetratricopeptide repeat protein [Amaricoccus sp.]|nr:tetratricopeptide repeat protein [Amaricoccus sp.]
MSEEPDGTLDAFRRLLGTLPAGPGAGIELLLSQLPAEAAALLRLGAIPHAVDRRVAAVLQPETPPEVLDAAVAELLKLSFVTSDGQSGRLHDEARAYLFGQWLAARETDPARRRTFREVNERLAAHYAVRRGTRVGQRRDIAERSEVYHRLAAEDPGAFGHFQARMDAERRSFRLEACEALLKVVAELEPLLDPGERAWLGYWRARLLADQRRYDEAVEGFIALRADPATAEHPRLFAAVVSGLHDAYRGQRDFRAALAALDELLGYLKDRPEGRQRQLEATQSMASLLLEMRETKRAEALATTLLEAPGLDEDRSLEARTWNTLGSIHKRLGRPRRALEAYEQALALLEAAGERFRPMQVYNNIGALHAERAEWEPARASLERALAIAREAGDVGGEAAALGNLERVYSGLGQESQAVAATERAVELFRTIHDWHSAATLSRNLARRRRRGRDEAGAAAAFREAAGFYRVAGETAEAERCLADATGRRERTWGLGRWLAVTAGLAVGVIVLVVIVAAALGVL